MERKHLKSLKDKISSTNISSQNNPESMTDASHTKAIVHIDNGETELEEEVIKKYNIANK